MSVGSRRMKIDLTTFDLGGTRAVVSQEFPAARSASSGADCADALQSFTFSARAFAENCRADAHQRRALLDRDWEIVRHSHGQMGKLYIKFLFQHGTQLPQSHKRFPRRFCFLSNRRDYHQTLDRQSRQREEQFHFRTYGLRFETELAPLTRH